MRETDQFYLIFTPTISTLGQYTKYPKQNGRPATLMMKTNKAAFFPLVAGFLKKYRISDPIADPKPK